MTARLADQDARDRIRGEFDRTLVVEAASGTGKTSELVRRMVALLAAGRARLPGIVAVTFTEAAAGEMKLRLRSAIEEARHDPDCGEPARRLLTEALPQLEEARIGTIHSFCADLLRERPVEAEVDPLFEVAPEDVAEVLLDRAFDQWFESRLAAPDEGVRRILRRRTRTESARRLLRSAAGTLVEWRDFPAPWRPGGGFDRDGTIDAIMAEMAALGSAAADGDTNDFFTRSLAAIDRFAREVRGREAIRGRDHDGLEAELVRFGRERHWGWVGFRSSGGSFPKEELKGRRALLHAKLQEFAAAAGADLAPRLRDELWPVVERYEHLKVRSGRVDFLDLLLRARNLVRGHAGVRTGLQRRFTHLIVDEFQDTDPLQAEILLLLAADDPAQTDWRRVRPVPGKLFLVGDPKQSIYSFRRADVALYEGVKRQLLGAGAALVELNVSFRSVPGIQQAVNAAFAPRMRGASPSQPRYVPLAPFRPAPGTQPEVVVLPVPAPYGDFRKIVDWKIEESLPDASAAFVEWLVRESGWTVTERGRPERVPVQPRHVCLLFRRFRSFGEDATQPYVRALEARHLPHLLIGGSAFHRREEVEAIRNALAAIERPDDELSVFATLRGPLFALADGTLLAFRERYGTIHPFRRLPDATTDATTGATTGTPRGATTDARTDAPTDATTGARAGAIPETLREVVEALAVLRGLHRGRNRRSIADTIGRLLGAVRAHAGLAIWPTGEQALANVARLMDLARRAERSGITSFRAFVERLAEQAESGEAASGALIEEGTEGVRIMTVHRAKGLEFPVVLLADMTARETPVDPSRWVEPERGLCAMRLAGCVPPELREHAEDELARERDEAARVLYVAATRARDLLVVPAIGDERYDGWLGALDPALYPEPARSAAPETRQPPGCPAFGTDSVPFRPPSVTRPMGSVAPGLHAPEAGEHRVVWWDPSALRLNVKESGGLAQQKLLAADESGVRVEKGVRDHAEWQDIRARVRTQAAAPSLRVVTVTELAGETGAGATGKSASAQAAAAASRVNASGSATTLEVTVIDASGSTVPGDEARRPSGKRYGSLVHAVLAAVPLDADRPEITIIAEQAGRLLGAAPDEVAAATASAARALAHPMLRRAAAAERRGLCRRETAIEMLLPDGRILEGVVDLAFQDAEPRGRHGAEFTGWIVVDFKTDVEITGNLDVYHRQVRAYADAIARATGREARAVLLRV